MATGTATLERIKRETAIIEVKGTAPLIVHAWSEKARRMMPTPDGQEDGQKLKDRNRLRDSRYRFADGSGDGFPVMDSRPQRSKGGGRIFGKAVKMTELRQNFAISLPMGSERMRRALRGSSDPDPIVAREDMVRVGMGTADIRYRAEFRRLVGALRIQFVPDLIDLGSVTALVDAGGTNGIGEWRPEKNGSVRDLRGCGEELA